MQSTGAISRWGRCKRDMVCYKKTACKRERIRCRRKICDNLLMGVGCRARSKVYAQVADKNINFWDAPDIIEWRSNVHTFQGCGLLLFVIVLSKYNCRLLLRRNRIAWEKYPGATDMLAFQNFCIIVRPVGYC